MVNQAVIGPCVSARDSIVNTAPKTDADVQMDGSVADTHAQPEDVRDNATEVFDDVAEAGYQ